jgi:hypothetical protein
MANGNRSKGSATSHLCRQGPSRALSTAIRAAAAALALTVAGIGAFGAVGAASAGGVPTYVTTCENGSLVTRAILDGKVIWTLSAVDPERCPPQPPPSWTVGVVGQANIRPIGSNCLIYGQSPHVIQPGQIVCR